jgi:ABC-type uncharacterized transport system substrate-binding protein
MSTSLFKIALVACIVIGLALPAQAARRVLYVDSYHKGYPWSDGITQAVKSTLEKNNIALRIFRMDTKRNGSEEYKKKTALNVCKVITKFQPDLVIASDDNASKYVIMPYYKDARLPFVFCGVNYTADGYGFPYSNVTGMVELPPAIKLIYSLKHFTRIAKVGYLASDTLTERKDGMFTKREIREEFVQRYVKTFSQWKKEFLRLQDEVDVLIIGNNAGIRGWKDNVARSFAEDNTRIVTGCLLDWMAPLAFISATRSAAEQGRYAAKVALKILDGTPPSNIPITGNVEANIIINMKIANKLGKKIPNSFKKIASKIIE